MPSRKTLAFDVEACLVAAGLAKRAVAFARGEAIFTQGDASDTVMYVRSGGVQLSVISHAGKEAVVATLRPRDFLGEGALAGQPVRLATARATTGTTVLIVPKRQMIKLLRTDHVFSDRFLAYMLVRNARLEADLVDQLFNSSEKRLARILLLLSHYGSGNKPQQVLPAVSQETLAQTIGTTRPRVNFFLNKFRKLGLIEYDGDQLTINPSLLTVVVHE